MVRRRLRTQLAQIAVGRDNQALQGALGGAVLHGTVEPRILVRCDRAHGTDNGRHGFVLDCLDSWGLRLRSVIRFGGPRDSPSPELVAPPAEAVLAPWPLPPAVIGAADRLVCLPRFCGQVRRGSLI